MSVEHLQQAGPLHLAYRPVVERPVEVRMVDRRYAPGLDYRVNVGLQRRHDVARVDGLDDPRNPDAVDVDRRLASAEPDADLLAGHHQRLPEAATARAVVQQRQVVVVAQHEKVIAVPPVPARDLVRVLVPVRLGRVRMDVALVPLFFAHSIHLSLRYCATLLRDFRQASYPVQPEHFTVVLRGPLLPVTPSILCPLTVPSNCRFRSP